MTHKFQNIFVYVGGAYKTYAVIGVLEFNKTLAPVHFMKLTLSDFKCVSTIKRVVGTEILLIGAWCSIIAAVYDQKLNKFKILNIFQNLFGNSQVIRIAFSGKVMYFLGDESSELGVVEFDKRLELEQWQQIECQYRCDEKGTFIEKMNQAFDDALPAEEQAVEEDKNEPLKDLFHKDEGLVKRLNTAQVAEYVLPIDGVLCVDFSSDKRWILICHKKGVELYYMCEK